MTNLIYLGNFADVDPYENDYDAERGHDLEGISAGTDDLQIVSVYQYDHENDGVISDNEHTCDYIGYSVGGGTVYNQTDSTLLGTVAVTLKDGSVKHVEVVLIQQDNGDLFVTELLNDGSLDGLEIANIEITDITGTCYSGWYANQSVDGASICPVETSHLDGYVEGTEGNDVIDANYTGDPDGDCIDANDQILPGEGVNDDIVLAGGGDDLVLAGDGNDEIYGGEGDDTLCGQDGDDTVYGGDGNDILEGMNDNDLLFGQDGDDRIYGDAGDDTAVGGTGEDDIRGGSGEDKLYGGLDDDTIKGGSGDDMAFGGAGDDSISGGSGDDMLVGGGVSFDGKLDFNDLDTGELVNGQYTGNGVHIYSADPMHPVMIFDTANPTGGDSDLATGNLGNVLILSEDRDGNDPDDNGSGRGTFVFEFDGPAHVGSLDFLDIEGGAWIKMYDGDGNLIRQVDTGSTSNNGQLSQTINQDGVVRMEVIIQGSGAIDNLCYTLDGNAEDGDDVIDGGSGDDTILGGDGDDTLDGGADSDVIFGGNDADTILGGAGDTVDGGAGGDDHDVLDLTGKGPFFVAGPGGVGDPIPDSNGNGIDGQIVFVDGDGNPTGEVIDFVEIEEIIGDEINRGPDAVDDGFDAGEDDAPADIGNVLDNDSDPDGDPLTVGEVNGDPNAVGTPVAGDNGGLVTIDADGNVTFDPNGDFEALGEGEEATTTVTYTVDDGQGGTEEATVTITVTGVNDGPNAEDSAYVVDQDEAAGDVDANAITDDTGAGADSDPEGDPLDVVAVAGAAGNVGNAVAGDNGGLFTINADGSVDFDANGEFDALGDGESATTSVTYTIADPDGATDTATVTFTVTGTNDDPVAVRNDYVANFDEAAGDVDGNVLTDDTGDGVDGDPENDPLTVVGVGAPNSGVGTAVAGSAGGLFTILADGTIDFDANGEFDDLGLNDTRTTTVEYTISDGNGGTSTAVATFTVSGINDGTVQGTDGDDIINPDIPYVDADGDVVDNNDAILPGDTGNDDLILGFGGNDSIDAGDGDDRVFGGDGNDTIDGGVGNDGLVGDDGDDIIEGNDGDDMLFGNAGNDQLFGGDGMDKLEGGTGDDLLEGGDGNDDLWAGAGNDRVVGGDGDDVANGGSGNDVILGNAGNDTLDGASGDDTIRGGEGDDSIDGSFGNDSIVGGEGSDVVDGGNGNDVINTGNHADPAFDNPYPGLGAPDADPNNDLDTVFGGLGDDTILTGDDADSIDGGGGRDFIDAGIDNDIVDAGTGNDTVIGGEGVDLIDGGDGDDVLYGGLDNDTFDIVDTDPDGNPVDLLPGNNIDTIEGGAGNDTIFGRDDADVLFGGTGNDVIDGGIDNDVITGGEGEDELFGGQGSDTFLGGNGGDVVVGGEDTPSGTFPDGADIDVLDLTGSNVERIEYVPGDPEAGTVFFMDGTTMTFSEIENVIPCFTPGTTIATPRGERLVEELQVGDKVITRDNGIQEIAWVGHKAMNGRQLAANPHLKPILIKAGSLGQGLPERDMLVSPNHRVLVASDKTQLYFEEREVLAAAKHMTGADGIHAVNVMQTTYVHFMFERHEVVLSNGAWTESFQPGDYSLKGIGNSQRNEILELFPELATTTGLEGYQAARKALKKHEARLLMK